jgi:hypothetical protein
MRYCTAFWLEHQIVVLVAYLSVYLFMLSLSDDWFTLYRQIFIAG